MNVRGRLRLAADSLLMLDTTEEPSGCLELMLEQLTRVDFS